MISMDRGSEDQLDGVVCVGLEVSDAASYYEESATWMDTRYERSGQAGSEQKFNFSKALYTSS